MEAWSAQNLERREPASAILSHVQYPVHSKLGASGEAAQRLATQASKGALEKRSVRCTVELHVRRHILPTRSVMLSLVPWTASGTSGAVGVSAPGHVVVGTVCANATMEHKVKTEEQHALALQQK
jgi:hypothetical protein